MNREEQYDDAMFDFSAGNFDRAVAKLKAILNEEPSHFEAQLSLGMAYYRTGDLPAAIVEGHKAELEQAKRKTSLGLLNPARRARAARASAS